MRRKKQPPSAKTLGLLADAAAMLAQSLYANVSGQPPGAGVTGADMKSMKDTCGAIKELAAVIRSLDGESRAESRELTVRFLDGAEYAE